MGKLRHRRLLLLFLAALAGLAYGLTEEYKAANFESAL